MFVCVFVLFRAAKLEKSPKIRKRKGNYVLLRSEIARSRPPGTSGSIFGPTDRRPQEETSGGRPGVFFRPPGPAAAPTFSFSPPAGRLRPHPGFLFRPLLPSSSAVLFRPPPAFYTAGHRRPNNFPTPGNLARPQTAPKPPKHPRPPKPLKVPRSRTKQSARPFGRAHLIPAIAPTRGQNRKLSVSATLCRASSVR